MGALVAVLMAFGLGLIAPTSTIATAGAGGESASGGEAATSIETVMAKVADSTLDVRASLSPLDESHATVLDISSDTGAFISGTGPVMQV